jgi:hypothetical protein
VLVFVENHTMDDHTTVLFEQVFVCQECRRPWLDPHERWRLYLDDEEPAQTVPYCPACASREFD